MISTLNNTSRFLFLLLSLILLLCFSSCSSSSSTTKEWTVMVYLDGDDDVLEGNALIDFNEMEKGLSDAISAGNSNNISKINIIVMIDRYGGGGGVTTITEEGGSDWSDTRLYRVKPDDNINYFNSERLDDGSSAYSNHTAEYGEKNMGDPSTLSAFINFSKENFPANHYALILWNHGGAAQKKKKSATQSERRISKAICWDSDNGGDTLYLDELQQALEDNFDSADKLDIIGFDACLMSTIEVAYEFRNLADYMVGSMNYIQSDGWSYDRIFGDITDFSITAPEFSTRMVQAYKAFIDSTPANWGYQDFGETISVTDLSKISNLAEKVDALGVAIANENRQTDIEELREASYNYYDINPGSESTLDSIAYPYYDLYDLCERININNDENFSQELRDAAGEVMTALATTILYSYGDTNIIENTGQDQTAYNGNNTSKGLSIFFSRGDETYGQNSDSHYAYQWWYTSEDTAAELGDSSMLYGHIDFCTSNEDNTVDGWRELMEYWYDNPDSATPSTY